MVEIEEEEEEEDFEADFEEFEDESEEVEEAEEIEFKPFASVVPPLKRGEVLVFNVVSGGQSFDFYLVFPLFSRSSVDCCFYCDLG